jgi:sugar phosphate permease
MSLLLVGFVSDKPGNRGPEAVHNVLAIFRHITVFALCCFYHVAVVALAMIAKTIFFFLFFRRSATGTAEGTASAPKHRTNTLTQLEVSE